MINLENTLVYYELKMSSEENQPSEHTLRFVVNGRAYQGDVRPGSLDFLKSLSSKYEVIIFSSAHKAIVDAVIDQLENMAQSKLCSIRL